MLTAVPFEAAPVIAAELARSKRVLILSHTNPDGDAIGCMLGVWHVLHALGKDAVPLASSSVPGFLDRLPGIEQVQVHQPGSALPQADLLWIVDTSSLPRVGAVYDDHAAALKQMPTVVVDHHVAQTGPGKVNLIDAQAASCAELLYTLIRAMDVSLPAEAATCLLMGMTTDTQSFQTSSTRSSTLRIAADLIDAGAAHRDVVDQVYFTTPYGTAHLVGMSLNHLQRDGGLLWTHISQEMMARTQADDGAYDDVISVMQRIEGMRIAVLFKERGPNTVKLSLRSTPDIDVAIIANTWGGGGHAQAAGATLNMDLTAAQHEVLPVLRARLQAS